MANPFLKQAITSRLADTPGYAGDRQDPTLPGEPTGGNQDELVIKQAAANDPVIAAIARVIGIQV